MAIPGDADAGSEITSGQHGHGSRLRSATPGPIITHLRSDWDQRRVHHPRNGVIPARVCAQGYTSRRPRTSRQSIVRLGRCLLCDCVVGTGPPTSGGGSRRSSSARPAMTVAALSPATRSRRGGTSTAAREIASDPYAASPARRDHALRRTVASTRPDSPSSSQTRVPLARPTTATRSTVRHSNADPAAARVSSLARIGAVHLVETFQATRQVHDVARLRCTRTGRRADVADDRLAGVQADPT
jgi:hypothetical protein